MVDVVIDTSGLDVLRAGWSRDAHRAWISAFKGEAFRLKTVAQRQLSTGVGPYPAPLTERERASGLSGALSPLARFVAYEVSDLGPGDVEARIGFSRSVSRVRRAGARKKQLVALFEGGSHPITREDQARIAYKLRRRLGEPVRRPGSRGMGRKLKARRAGHSWADLGAWLPAVGAVLRWPARDWIADVVRSEGPNSRHNIPKLFAVAVAGRRWSRGLTWADEFGRFVG